jgi:hypothetical protein
VDGLSRCRDNDGSSQRHMNWGSVFLAVSTIIHVRTPFIHSVDSGPGHIFFRSFLPRRKVSTLTSCVQAAYPMAAGTMPTKRST